MLMRVDSNIHYRCSTTVQSQALWGKNSLLKKPIPPLKNLVSERRLDRKHPKLYSFDCLYELHTFLFSVHIICIIRVQMLTYLPTNVRYSRKEWQLTGNSSRCLYDASTKKHF